MYYHFLHWNRRICEYYIFQKNIMYLSKLFTVHMGQQLWWAWSRQKWRVKEKLWLKKSNFLYSSPTISQVRCVHLLFKNVVLCTFILENDNGSMITISVNPCIFLCASLSQTFVNKKGGESCSFFNGHFCETQKQSWRMEIAPIKNIAWWYAEDDNAFHNFFLRNEHHAN